MSSVSYNQTKSGYWVLFIPLVLIATTMLLVFTRSEINDQLQLALLADLMITIPLIHFLLIRKRNIPNITAIPLSLFGLFLAGEFLSLQGSWWFEWVRPLWIGLAETVVFLFIISKIISLKRAYKNFSSESRPIHEIIQLAVHSVIPGLAGTFFAGEILTFYFAFNFKRSKELKSWEFKTYSSEQGLPVYILVIFLLITETVIFHILLQKWSLTAAWILSGISIYSLIQITGIIRSLSHVPSRILEDKLILNYGIFYRAEIPLEQIRMAASESDLTSEKGFRLVLLGKLEPVNVKLILKEPVAVSRMYGRAVVTEELTLYTPNPKELLSLIHKQDR